ncbi:MAG: phosphate ABC transporter substrate-binding protein, partial [Pseudonocardiales bacterium]|nr:phosphate ABC transporter substrate-binding protein [Pseudonocardiales bacterium]
YPLSSYSYMILPKDLSSNFSLEKGATLSTFADYFLCQGQQEAAALGYSPLPINLVQDAVDQVNQIPGSTQKLNSNNLSGCHNPTVSPNGGNLVVQNAPQPSPCDRLGASTQCATGTGGAQQSTPTRGGSGGAGTAGAAGGGSGGGSGGAAAGGAGGTDGTAAGGANGTLAAGNSGSAATTGIDPNTGQVIDGATSAGGSSSSDVSAVPVSVDAADNRRQMVLAALAVVLVLGLIFVPPLVARTMRNRAEPQEGPLR